MNKEFVAMFVNQIEKLMEASDKKDYIQDETGRYLKALYLEHLISEARELIKYGEYTIALENMLENLNEASILLDANIIHMARQAFGNQVTIYMEQLLYKLTIQK